MKKFRLLLLIVLALSFQVTLSALTVTISGTVTELNGTTPIPNHSVSIQDTNVSVFMYFNTVFTDANGHYSVTINNVPSGEHFIVTVLDCNGYTHYGFVYASGTPATVNFQLCPGASPPRTVMISGRVTQLGTNVPIANHLVVVKDTASGTYSYFNTAFTDTQGFYSFTIQNVPSDVWFNVFTDDCASVTHMYIANGKQTYHSYIDFNICDNTPPPLYTVTISGTIHSTNTSAAVPNHMVNIVDSSSGSFPYSNTVYTNSSGFYTVTITNVPYNTWFRVSTLDCNNMNHEQPVNSNYTPITVNFQICTVTPPPTATVIISGTVTDLGNGSPVSNQTLYITTDSTYAGFSYYNQVTTNTAGYYTVSIPNVPLGVTFSVGTYDCNSSWHYQIVNSNNSPLTVNFQICTGGPTLFNINGAVLTGNARLDIGKVDLIRIDSLSVMTVVDTWYIQDTMNGCFHFFSVPAGSYYLMAEVSDNSVYAGQYAPTYYDSTIYWSSAIVISSGLYPEFFLHMVPLNLMLPGNGGISGTITQNLKTSVPVADVEVLLLDQNNQPLAYTRTNASGEYSFGSLAYGDYIVYPEITGVTTIPSPASLSAGSPNASINFLLKQGNIITGIHHQTPEGIGSISPVFPNPPVDNANLTVTATRDELLNLSVINSTGQSIRDFKFNALKGMNTISFTTAGMTPGLYYIKISNTGTGEVLRKFSISH